MSAISVVIPAHDEATVIGRALTALVDTHAEIVVVANGCSDRTAEIARDFDTDAVTATVRVLELEHGSKIKALNAGSADVSAYPVAYVDADVIVSGAVLSEIAGRMDEVGALVAAPRMIVLPSRSWWVRQYYRVWALTDYRASGHIGSGVYILSSTGRARFEEFPDVIADDLYVQRLFAPHERFTPAGLTFSVHAPGTLRALLGRNTRIAAGNQELAVRFPELTPPATSVGGARSLLSRVWRRPSLWAGFAVYTAVYLTAHRRAARLLRSRASISWNRDHTTREQTT
ncbi:MAG: glycosyltransferase [Microbacterium pygmaeum]